MREKKTSNRSSISKERAQRAGTQSQKPGIVPIQASGAVSFAKAAAMPKKHAWGKGKAGKASAAEQAVAMPKGNVQGAQLAHVAKSMTAEERAIENWITSVQFKRQAIGGLDEADVWKKVKELHELYDRAITAERARCDAMVEHYRRQAAQAQAQRRVQRPTDASAKDVQGARANDPRANAASEARGL